MFSCRESLLFNGRVDRLVPNFTFLQCLYQHHNMRYVTITLQTLPRGRFSDPLDGSTNMTTKTNAADRCFIVVLIAALKVCN